ncbi:MarR family winged helix-turn-helix transcriptional regulator [Lentzea atacamensis]|uniref:MarR family winged helix-turn-helix transcriptional regulator n=1 Tax=Lentzea atacamensis TaxID=531938 RepID=UPI0011BE03D8|nr:MarR family transcriptional regulator [Lentzea atacamensis]
MKLQLLMDVCRRPDGSRWRGGKDIADDLLARTGVEVTPSQISALIRGAHQNPHAKTRDGLAELFGVPLEYLAAPVSDRIRRITAEVHDDLLRQQRDGTASEHAQDSAAEAGDDAAAADEAMLTTTFVLGVNQQVKAIAAGIAEESGLTPSQAEALLQLANTRRSMTLGEFASACGKPGPTMTRVADALEAQELICQCPLETDRRVRRVTISTKGQELVDRHTRAPAAAVLEALDLEGMDPASRAIAFKVLGALAGLKDGAPTGTQTAPGEVDKDSPGPPDVRGVA